MTPPPARARWAVSAQFFTNGVITASLLPRLPEVKAAFDLSDTAYGFMVVAMPLGSIAAAALAGPLIRRFGALRVAATGTVILAFLVTGAGFSPWAWLFALCMAGAGFSDAILDTGQNVHGMAVERWYGKSIINSMHAAWSLGATLGGLIGAASASAGIPIGWQLLVGAVVWSAVAIAAALAESVPEQYVRAAQEEADDAPPSPADGDPRAAATGSASPARGDQEARGNGRRRFPWGLFIPLAVLAICGTLVEEVANNWVTLYLNRETGATIGLAGTGFAVMLCWRRLRGWRSRASLWRASGPLPSCRPLTPPRTPCRASRTERVLRCSAGGCGSASCSHPRPWVPWATRSASVWVSASWFSPVSWPP